MLASHQAAIIPFPAVLPIDATAFMRSFPGVWWRKSASGHFGSFGGATESLLGITIDQIIGHTPQELWGDALDAATTALHPILLPTPNGLKPLLVWEWRYGEDLCGAAIPI